MNEEGLKNIVISWRVLASVYDSLACMQDCPEAPRKRHKLSHYEELLLLLLWAALAHF